MCTCVSIRSRRYVVLLPSGMGQCSPPGRFNGRADFGPWSRSGARIFHVDKLKEWILSYVVVAVSSVVWLLSCPTPFTFVEIGPEVPRSFWIFLHLEGCPGRLAERHLHGMPF